jgi:hypothetical protein
VIKYLGRYTHRVGISNARLESMDHAGNVTFRTKNGQKLTLAADVFLGRFLQHVLPNGFVKIRHDGLLAPANVATRLAAAKSMLTTAAASPPTAATTSPPAPATPASCPFCGAAGLRRVDVIAIPSLQRALVASPRGPP